MIYMRSYVGRVLTAGAFVALGVASALFESASPEAAPQAPTPVPPAVQHIRVRPAPNPPQVEAFRSKIQHIVFIVKENRSFDTYFGTFPGADGTTTGMMSTGERINAAARTRPHGRATSATTGRMRGGQ